LPKISGIKEAAFQGGRLGCSISEHDAIKAILGRKIKGLVDVIVIRYEGPKRRSGHAGDASRPTGGSHRGRDCSTSVALITDARFSGGFLGLARRTCLRLRLPSAGTIALVKNGDSITPRRGKRSDFKSNITSAEIKAAAAPALESRGNTPRYKDGISG